MNRRFVLKVLNDPKKKFKTLFMGIEMDMGTILELFDKSDDILVENREYGRRVYVKEQDFNCRFIELRDY